MVTSLTTLYPLVPLPGASDAVLLQGLCVAGRDFCERTLAWRETVTAELSSGDTSAQLTLAEATGQTPVTSASIGRVLKVTIDDSSNLLKTLRRQDYEVSESGLLSWTWYEPATGDDLSAVVAVYPDLDRTTYPDWIVRDWGRAIAAKARGDLRLEPNEDWSDERAGARDLAEYERLVGRAQRTFARKGPSFFAMRPPVLAGPPRPGPLAWTAGYAPDQSS